MLQLENKTPFVAQIAILRDEFAAETIYLAIRATFSWQHTNISLIEEHDPISMADEYYGDPTKSSMRRAAEIHLTKPTSDIVLLGDAWAPNAREVESLLVSLCVGPVREEVLVTGDRHWGTGILKSRITAPVPFHRMPLRYERAFGGIHPGCEAPGESDFETRNPIGCGFVNPHRWGSFNQLILPNLEHPAYRFTKPGERLVPVGFGFIAPSWQPRRSLAGTYDSAWERERAPFLPLDYQPAFQNTAHPCLIAPDYLQGGEPLELVNLSPFPRIRFTLPVCRFDVRAFVAGAGPLRRVIRPHMYLDTVLLEPSKQQFSLLWCGAVPCDKQALQVERITAHLTRLETGPVYS